MNAQKKKLRNSKWNNIWIEEQNINLVLSLKKKVNEKKMIRVFETDDFLVC